MILRNQFVSSIFPQESDRLIIADRIQALNTQQLIIQLSKKANNPAQAINEIKTKGQQTSAS